MNNYSSYRNLPVLAGLCTLAEAAKPGLAVDEIAVVEGPQLASSDSWRVSFRGTGTHGAKPHLGRDPITAAGTFLASLQTIVGRVVDPLQPAVVSACSVQAGNPKALNVIPDIVEIGGTARAYAPEVRDQLEAEIGRLARGTAAMFGILADYEFERRIPPVVSLAGQSCEVIRKATSVLSVTYVGTADKGSGEGPEACPR